jgi:hypothetical protein
MNNFGNKCLMPTNIFGRKNTDTSTYGNKSISVNKKNKVFPHPDEKEKVKKSPLER